jgi:glycosyltransferase involved in cell wall biosynthesis
VKVLFLVDTFGSGGAERSLQELLPPFVRLGVEPVVACFHRRSQGVESLVSEQFAVHFLGNGSRLGQMRGVRRLLETERIELLHTTLFEADVFGRTAALGTGVPVVTSLVNMPYEPSRLRYDRKVNRAKLLAVRSLEIATGRLAADHFHAISHAVKAAAIERLFLPPDAVTVVHRGRDALRLGRRDPERRERVRRALRIDGARRVILSAAREEYQKGQRFLIDALARCADRSALLLIAGRQGSASAELRRLAAPLGERVIFLDHRDDVPDLMAAADVFALPSLWEGLGCVLIEAMALELPIVASDLPPVREVTQPADAARLVPAGDASALAASLDAIWEQPELERQRALRARRLFEERYTIERSASAMFELFQLAARQRRDKKARS